MSNSYSFNTSLLEILVCPVSKNQLTFDKNNNELVCHKSNLAYPIRDGIPILLSNQARKINK